VGKWPFPVDAKHFLGHTHRILMKKKDVSVYGKIFSVLGKSLTAARYVLLNRILKDADGTNWDRSQFARPTLPFCHCEPFGAW
jgi:hypothetical protein